MTNSLDNGYLYVATGQKYIDEAINSAKSLKKHNPNCSIAIISDVEIKSEHFNISLVETLPSTNQHEKNGYLSKMIGMLKSPFNKTIFVDTDTYFCDECDELFTLLNYFDLLICHDYRETSFASPDNKELVGYNTYNTGIIAFQKSTTVNDFISKWIDIFKNKIDHYWSDQPAFMEALLNSPLKTYSLQTIYNFRFNQFLTISTGKVKILHGRHDNINKIADIINYTSNHRSWNPRHWKCNSWEEKKSLKEKMFDFKNNIFNHLK